MTINRRTYIKGFSRKKLGFQSDIFTISEEESEIIKKPK